MRKIRFIAFILIFLTNSVYAAEFSATVSSKEINVGQSVTLRLSLKDAKAKQQPDLTPLLKIFTVHSQQQFSSYTNINGKSNSESGWDITLLPKKQGDINIPSISISTNQGLLTTKAIPLKVTEAGTKNSMDDLGISLSTSISKNSTYVKEPVVYTLKIISYKPWANITLEDIKSNDAIVEKYSEPAQYDEILGGVRAHIIEVKYYITPLKAGKIDILPPFVHGEIQTNAQQMSTSRFAMPTTYFEYKPFSLQGKAEQIQAKAPASKSNDWLPLQDLVITEKWQSNKEVVVGDTITRDIRIVAKGAFSSQIPDLKKFLEVDSVKVYANKPVTTDKIDPRSDILVATKEESFSIVPRKDGLIELPEVKIPWWNLRTNQQEYATLPAKKIAVQPASNAVEDQIIDYTQPIKMSVVSQKDNTLLYIISIISMAIIIALVGVIFYLLRPRKSRARKVKTPSTLLELKHSILQFASKKWQAPDDLALSDLGIFLAENNFEYDAGKYVELVKSINDSLYDNKRADLAELTTKWRKFHVQVIKSKHKPKSSKILKPVDLNPT